MLAFIYLNCQGPPSTFCIRCAIEIPLIDWLIDCMSVCVYCRMESVRCTSLVSGVEPTSSVCCWTITPTLTAEHESVHLSYLYAPNYFSMVIKSLLLSIQILQLHCTFDVIINVKLFTIDGYYNIIFPYLVNCIKHRRMKVSDELIGLMYCLHVELHVWKHVACRVCELYKTREV